MAEKTKKKPVGRRLTPDAPLDPAKMQAIMDEEHEPHADPVKIWPMSAEEALRKAMSTRVPREDKPPTRSR